VSAKAVDVVVKPTVSRVAASALVKDFGAMTMCNVEFMDVVAKTNFG
jgi:hypothetical protein